MISGITRAIWLCFWCQIYYQENMGPNSWAPVIHGIGADGAPVQSKRCPCGRKLGRLSS